jgi:ribosomal protein S18 acetylase RimI-like enzyme
MTDVETRPLRVDEPGADDISEVAALARAEDWPTFADPASLRRLASAPGTLTMVAVAATPRAYVVGFAHALSNGHHAYLSVMAVDRAMRGYGIGRQLVEAIFERSGVQRMDLLSVPESEGFYDRLPNRRLSGYRLFP